MCLYTILQQQGCTNASFQNPLIRGVGLGFHGGTVATSVTYGAATMLDGEEGDDIAGDSADGIITVRNVEC